MQIKTKQPIPHVRKDKAKQRCVMGVGMCLYALALYALCKRTIPGAKVQL